MRQILSQTLLLRTALFFCAAISAWGFFDADSLISTVRSILGFVFDRFGGFFLLTTTAFPLLMLLLAVGPWGRLRLGKDDERPEFSRGSWFAMLFAAGMGVGLMFWGLAEPVTHWASPPVGDPRTAASLKHAMAITAFHWGVHAWAIYGVSALVVAYFSFRRGQPAVPGASLRSAFSEKWVFPVAWCSDLLAVVAVAFGVAGSIGMGVLQLRAGLHEVAQTPANAQWVSVVVVLTMVAAYMASAATSLNKGIKWLSNINMTLAMSLLLFILIVGPTGFELTLFLKSIAAYFTELPSMSFDPSYLGQNRSWFHGWTLKYFVWWIAWSPFVGVFIARISRGRTIREFVLVVLVAPTVFSLLWFGAFGGAGLFEELHGAGGIAAVVKQDVTRALFELFARYPLTVVLSVIALLLTFIFLVTSADSATFVLGMMSTGSLDPPRAHKITWGLIIGGLGASLALTGEIRMVEAMAIFGALPFVLVMILQCIALVKALLQESRAKEKLPE